MVNQTHELFITTGDLKGSEASDILVYITLRDDEHTSSEIPIHRDNKQNFKRGDTLNIPMIAPEIKHVTGITIRREDDKVDQKWFINKIVIIYLDGERKESTFPVLRWVNVGTQLQLEEFDCSLPQNDKHVEQREKELRAKREHYMLSGRIPGCPYVVENMPEDEQFSEEYATSNIVGMAEVIAHSVGFIDQTTSEFESLEDFEGIYRGLLPIPKGLESWQLDEEFGNQKLAGCNPVLLELCTEIPSHLPVTHATVAHALERKALNDSLQQKRMYVIDLRYLADIECSEDRKLPGPTCLFYRKDNGELIPVAIQLMPEAGVDNPVFTSEDPKYTWLAAKMWFNLADCSHHQSCTHLGFTHLMMESAAVCTHRRLSQSHPIFKLLAPHFLFLMAINENAAEQLINPGGWVDRALQMGRAGMFNIVKRNRALWKLNVNGNLVNNLKSRGVDDVKALPNYPYRDDALLLWHAIENYVTAYVNGVYAGEEFAKDTEIHAWIKDLHVQAEIGGVPYKLTAVCELIEVLTELIFNCSVQHAAVNFGQYDEYAFPPNYPGFLRSERPKDKKPLDEDYIVASLPTKKQALDMITITRILSMFGTSKLGNFEIQYAYDDNAMSALKSFREELKKVGDQIKERDQLRARPYPYLHPKLVPNAISI